MNFWLARKMIFNRKFFSEPTTIFAISGIALGVALLVVVMAGFTGFTKALERNIIDFWGDIAVFKRGGAVIREPEDFRLSLIHI